MERTKPGQIRVHRDFLKSCDPAYLRNAVNTQRIEKDETKRPASGATRIAPK